LCRCAARPEGRETGCAKGGERRGCLLHMTKSSCFLRCPLWRVVARRGRHASQLCASCCSLISPIASSLAPSRGHTGSRSGSHLVPRLLQSTGCVTEVVSNQSSRASGILAGSISISVSTVESTTQPGNDGERQAQDACPDPLRLSSRSLRFHRFRRHKQEHRQPTARRRVHCLCCFKLSPPRATRRLCPPRFSRAPKQSGLRAESLSFQPRCKGRTWRTSIGNFKSWVSLQPSAGHKDGLIHRGRQGQSARAEHECGASWAQD